MTTDAIYEERGSDWSHQVSAVGTTQWLQRDQTLPLSVKGVACETTLVEELFQSGFQSSNPIGQFIIHNYTHICRAAKKIGGAHGKCKKWGPAT